jgi:hypothetical protein
VTGADDGEVTVVVVTWQGAHLVPDALDSLRAQTLPHRVLVVDNASTDGTPEVLARYPEAQVLRTPRNLGFAGGAQAGIDAVRTEFVALLNNDAVAAPGWLEALVRSAREHPDAAAITSLMLLSGREPATVNNAGVVLLPTGYGADRGLGEAPQAVAEPSEVFGFSGGAALLRTAAVRDVGGFARHFFLYYEDTDLSWRLRTAGWTVRYEPGAVVHHQHSATADQGSARFAFYNERNRLLMLLRCAPPGTAVTASLRFLATTASLAARWARHPRRPVPHNLRPALRLRVACAVLARVPAELAARRAMRRTVAGRPVSGPASGAPASPGARGA